MPKTSPWISTACARLAGAIDAAVLSEGVPGRLIPCRFAVDELFDDVTRALN